MHGIGQVTGLLMSGQIKADEWVTRARAAADTVAGDPVLTKYRHR